MPNFMEMLRLRWKKGLFGCVGLDTVLEKIPEAAMKKHNAGGSECEIQRSIVYGFNRDIIDMAVPHVSTFKPNIAFYGDRIESGIEALVQTIDYVKKYYPEIPIILDSKRADIGNTNDGYVRESFELYGADAITVNPYLGAEALKPFLKQKDKGIFILCRTSNPGAGEFQDRPTFVLWEELDALILNDLSVAIEVCKWRQLDDGVLMPAYQYVALKIAHDPSWNFNGNCALVTGATFPEELGMLRFLAPDLPFLIPGVGFQQKNVPLEQQVKQVVDAGKDSNREGMIINSSRGILYASSGADYVEAAQNEIILLEDLINKYR